MEDRAALLPASPRQSPWRPGPFLSLALLVVVWWVCSAWNAVVSKRVLRRGTGSDGEALLRVAIVSAASNVLGVLGMVAMRFVPRLRVIRPVVGREIAAAHATGLYAAYRGASSRRPRDCVTDCSPCSPPTSTSQRIRRLRTRLGIFDGGEQSWSSHTSKMIRGLLHGAVNSLLEEYRRLSTIDLWRIGRDEKQKK